MQYLYFPPFWQGKSDRKVHPHQFRHACGYHLASQGATTRDIQAYLVHKNIQHSVRYTAQNPKRFEHFNWDWDGKNPF